MGRLNDATARLASALDRLDTALARTRSRGPSTAYSAAALPPAISERLDALEKALDETIAELEPMVATSQRASTAR